MKFSPEFARRSHLKISVTYTILSVSLSLECTYGEKAFLKQNLVDSYSHFILKEDENFFTILK